MYRSDTIAATSTPPGIGGIGIIRMSGMNAFNIAAKVFSGKKAIDQIKSHSVNYGTIVDPENGETIDEVLLIKLHKPNTFTREDTIEINCHGGTVVMRRILELLLRNGASPAEPGEFTKRAFLNGRIDLTQAEAVIDLINSKTEESSKAAVNQLEGKLSRELKRIRERLVELLAHIEVTVDYPEHDIEEITAEKTYSEMHEIIGLLKKTIRGFETGRIIREGINAVIIGRPNVGKSSLLNELSGKNRAIVTEIPGTTRDIIEEYINIRGIPVNIIDTAGLRETEDPVEAIGVKKAEQAISRADLILLLLNAAEGIKPEDFEILGKVRRKKLIVLINKTDIKDISKEDEQKLKGILKEAENCKSTVNVIRTSLLEVKGVEELESAISDMFTGGELSSNSEILVTNIRHKYLIDNALKNLEEACMAYEGGMPLDCLSIDIRAAAENIGLITGESISDEVLHSIFSRFCIGK